MQFSTPPLIVVQVTVVLQTDGFEEVIEGSVSQW
jgi:hypothetical protein